MLRSPRHGIELQIVQDGVLGVVTNVAKGGYQSDHKQNTKRKTYQSDHRQKVIQLTARFLLVKVP